MKTVNVMVMLQIDINGEGDDVVEVQEALGIVNDTLYEAQLNSQPVIFTNNLCEADILEPLDEEEE